jgi:SAM-dependent methyltransferase
LDNNFFKANPHINNWSNRNLKRSYGHFDTYLDRLQKDIYPQPPDDLQQAYGDEVINNWVQKISDIKTVLDVGCGQGQFAQTFKDIGVNWEGVTLGNDAQICRDMGLDVFEMDFSFLSFMADNHRYDLIFARHCLEHSPFPVITLMEWYRVSKKYLCVILPNPLGIISKSHVGAFRGQNHYSVMTREHFLWLAERAGWKLYLEQSIDFEMRFMLEKGIPITK